MVDTANHDSFLWRKAALRGLLCHTAKIILADPHDMDMRNRTKAEHAARHPAQRLAGNLLDIRIIAAGRPAHPGQRILDRKARRGNIIGRG
jgi:hypothetical protein